MLNFPILVMTNRQTLLVSLWILLWAFSGLSAQTLRSAVSIEPIQLLAPMRGELMISGTFGEPRPNHYHSGMDIKTGGKTGWPVFAVAEGFVSRIKVSPGGYGHVIYMDHPNGLSSVYAHLDKFEPQLAKFVRNLQYQLQSFDIDTLLRADQFIFKKGQQIAWSGNSGSSAGPHLHFEIRETHSELALNPMRFGYRVKDQTPPTVSHLKFYPIAESFYDSKGLIYPLQQKNGLWTAPDMEVPEGFFSIAIRAFDRQDLSPEHKNGIPILRLYEDSVLLFQRVQDTVEFSLTRYSHALIDYGERIRSGGDFYLFSQLPGNLENRPYQNSPGNGRLQIRAGEVRKFRAVLEDFHGNQTTVYFSVKGIAAVPASQQYDAFPDKAGQKSIGTATISWEAGSFYDALSLEILEAENTGKDKWSHSYSVLLPSLAAIHTPLKIQIKPRELKANLKEKALLVLENAKNTKKALVTEVLPDGSLSATFNEPGKIYVSLDTTVPKIIPLNFQNGNKTFSGKEMRFRISDDLSGIKSHKGYIDGQWVLFEYDAKNALICYNFDEKCPPGEHELKLIVTDGKQNISTFTTTFKN
jgi:hypothetical protein